MRDDRSDRSQQGQVAIEWLGVLVLVAIVALSLVRFAPAIGAQVACGVREQIEALGGGSADGCGKAPARAAVRSSRPRTPFGAPDRPREADLPPWTTSRTNDLEKRQVKSAAVVPAALAAVAVACRIGRKGCIKIIKKTCDIPGPRFACNQAKKLGCKIAKVFCKPKPPPKPKWITAPITNQRLKQVGDSIDPVDKKGLLTYAGRSLDKHGGQGPFPAATGNQANKNAQGLRVLNRILDHPAATQFREVHKSYGRILQVDGPESVGGVRFALDANGNVTRLIHFRVVKPHGGVT